MNRVLEQSYNDIISTTKSKTLYDICVESKSRLLDGLLERYNRESACFLYGDTKEEVYSTVKSYKDYNTITQGVFKDCMDMVYQSIKPFTNQTNILEMINNPNKVVMEFIEYTKEDIKEWQKENLLSDIADMAQGDKHEYDKMVKESYAETTSVVIRIIATTMAIAMENYEDYLFDQIDEKENREPEVFFVMSSLHSHITERISFLSDISNDSLKHLL